MTETPGRDRPRLKPIEVAQILNLNFRITSLRYTSAKEKLGAFCFGWRESSA
jgi:hypothetical protein